MANKAIFTVIFDDYDPEIPNLARVKKVLVGNQEVRCTQLQLDFKSNGAGSLVLRIPLQYVDITVSNTED